MDKNLEKGHPLAPFGFARKAAPALGFSACRDWPDEGCWEFCLRLENAWPVGGCSPPFFFHELAVVRLQ